MQKLSRVFVWTTALLIVVALLLTGRSVATSAHLAHLIVALDDSMVPFTFRNEDGQLVGFEIDLLEAIAEEQDLHIEYINVRSAYKLAGVATQLYDLAAGCILVSPEHERFISFSTPYFSTGLMLLVQQDNETIHSYQDLTKEYTIGVRKDSKADEFARAQSEALRINIASAPEAIQQLSDRQIDAVLLEEIEVVAYLQQTANVAVKQVSGLLTYEECAFAVRSGNIELERQLNVTLEVMKGNGIYDKIYAKWFGKRIVPTPPPVTPQAASPTSSPAIPPLSPALKPGVYYLVANTDPPTYELASLAHGGFWFSIELTQTLPVSTTVPMLPTTIGTQLGVWQIAPDNQVTASVILLRQVETVNEETSNQTSTASSLPTVPIVSSSTESSASPDTNHLLRKDYQLHIQNDGTINGVYIASTYAMTLTNPYLLPTPGITYTIELTGYRVHE